VCDAFGRLAGFHFMAGWFCACEQLKEGMFPDLRKSDDAEFHEAHAMRGRVMVQLSNAENL
jgi:hypothetical protein